MKEYSVTLVVHVGLPKITTDGGGGMTYPQKVTGLILAKSAKEALEKAQDMYSDYSELKDIHII